MITPELLDSFLAVLQRRNVMSACIESGPDKIAVTIGPSFPEELVEKDNLSNQEDLVPGGWKTRPVDTYDPDPLGLGTLDAAPAEERIEPIDVEKTEL